MPHLDDLHEADQERLDLISALAGVVSRTRGVGLLVTGRYQPPGGYALADLDSDAEQFLSRVTPGCGAARICKTPFRRSMTNR